MNNYCYNCWYARQIQVSEIYPWHYRQKCKNSYSINYLKILDNYDTCKEHTHITMTGKIIEGNK